MKANITIMPGDGVGPEITREAVKTLQAIESVFDHDFSINEVLFGGIAIDETGTPYPEETQNACKNSDAVLLGAVIFGTERTKQCQIKVTLRECQWPELSFQDTQSSFRDT